MIISNTGDATASGPGSFANTGFIAAALPHGHARARCEALVGRSFRSPKGVVGRFTSVLERPGGRPPVVVGELPDGTPLRYTPSKGESLVIPGE